MEETIAIVFTVALFVGLAGFFGTMGFKFIQIMIEEIKKGDVAGASIFLMLAVIAIACALLPIAFMIDN